MARYTKVYNSKPLDHIEAQVLVNFILEQEGIDELCEVHYIDTRPNYRSGVYYSVGIRQNRLGKAYMQCFSHGQNVDTVLHETAHHIVHTLRPSLNGNYYDGWRSEWGAHGRQFRNINDRLHEEWGHLL